MDERERDHDGAAAGEGNGLFYHDDAQVEAMQRRVDAAPPLGGDDPYTIFRLPAAVRERHRDLYEPKVVSVGPYYHGRAGLGSAQQHKWRLLRDFLSRGKKEAAAGLGAYLRAAREVQADARRCYAERFGLGADEFAEMLVLDGCFLLEFFLKKGEGQLAAPGGSKWAWHHMYHDVLLLENQIPFFVIEKLHGVAFAGEDGPERDALLDIFCKAFAGDLPSSRTIRPPSDKTIHHLLHLHYECNVRNPAADNDKGRNTIGDANGASLAIWKQPAIPSPRSGEGTGTKGRLTSMVPPAAKMEEAGVTFKRKATPRDVFDASFRYGVLHMPAFVIDEGAKVLLANLVAFEQGGGRAARQLDGGNLVTGFVALVGSLVNSRRDLEVLRRCGIMHCMLADDDAVAYFNHVVQYTTMDYDRHLLACLFRDVREHCHWNR
ncbi:hypothetical protein BAE44_0005126 [Dichanthelium oligosanthes]|uniref:Uncharacterized protein n=1 Tax=Dichanthelium oligosanthes TaxID=888268 RepID=A0A1E5W8V8_9POAL|nr:hypothetical protein BAE44_0005126 [Dichanthelium oligosanthes]